MSFREHLLELPVDALVARARDASEAEVARALAAERRDLFDVAALLSPAAEPFLEEMARLAHRITVQRFGRTIQLYAPLYVSNECVESCTYCSFAIRNRIRRRTLTVAESVAEARILTGRGFRHLLLVSGEHPRIVPPEYIAEVLSALHTDVPSLSVEVQPQTEEVYGEWVRSGAEGLTIYQETYDREVYAEVHPRGKKRDFDWRLETPERGAAGGMKRIGIGALLGLSDWRLEGIHLAAHARYLMRRCWRAFISVSFPRLRPASFSIDPPRPVADRHLAQLVCAFRLFLPDLGLVLSTREKAAFRDGMIRLGITQMSAGSRTEPGGYSAPEETGKQFEIEDRRRPDEVSTAIRRSGYDPVWKDWEAALND
ncbi:MAG: 2-iminoacetate synthase ThiH [Planctomycetes bacterium]|nr:2-iminoacetate synthase ThiH [Planctomycetota bacterium]